ncbi:uncharacterized protein TNCV_1626741 [Trichonephila clavipes]|nr:uncharacterized protein TNCV_1626741 [Trichonephila clavipes]
MFSVGCNHAHLKTDAHVEGYHLTVAISSYRTSVQNVELKPPVQHNATLGDNFKIIAMISFHDVTGRKPGPDLSPNQLALRLACGSETTLNRKEPTTALICPVFVLLSPL